MDYKVILNLIKEMNNTDLTKVEIEEEGFRICLEKALPVTAISQPTMPQYMMSPSMPVGMSVPFDAAQAQAQNPQVTTATTAGDTVGAHTEEVIGKKLVSPMVGTFYSQPSPDKPAFIKVGDHVKKGQTICIIEAMKLMNEIESEHDGEVIKVLIGNEEMVEYGQPLFLIK